MNDESPFLNCHIISVYNTTAYNDFYLIEKIYHHNSLQYGIPNFEYTCIQIPEFEISNNHLLYELDYDFINKFSIPIIRRILELNTEYWKVDLTHYENQKLQSSNIS
jgi:hypothetical protein